MYTSLPGGTVQRPARELKAFASVALEPSETQTVTPTVRRKDLAYWDIRLDAWVVKDGEYAVDVAASSRDIRSTATVRLVGDAVSVPLTLESTMGEVLAHPVAGPNLRSALAPFLEGMAAMDDLMAEGVSMEKMLSTIPVGRIGMIAGDATTEVLGELLRSANSSGTRVESPNDAAEPATS